MSTGAEETTVWVVQTVGVAWRCQGNWRGIWRPRRECWQAWRLWTSSPRNCVMLRRIFKNIKLNRDYLVLLVYRQCSIQSVPSLVSFEIGNVVLPSSYRSWRSIIQNTFSWQNGRIVEAVLKKRRNLRLSSFIVAL